MISRIEKAILVAISFVLSALLWLQVSASSGSIKSQVFSAKIEYINLDPRFTVVVSFVEKLDCDASGSAKALGDLHPEDWKAQVDLKDVNEPGTVIGKVHLAGPSLENVEVVPRYRKIKVDVYRIKRIEFPVVIKETGTAPFDVKYAGATVSPVTVSLTGADILVNAIKEVRATLDLTKIRAGLSVEAAIEVIGEDGLPDRRVKSDPDKATIVPKIAAETYTSSVLVSPTWKGQPKFGYEVESFDVRPNQVGISGQPENVQSIRTVQTEEIDISELAESKQFSVKLRPLPGAVIADPEEVKIFVKLKKAGT